MALTICKKLCDECPFTNTSFPGWLGGYTVDDTLHAQQYDIAFACHKTRGNGGATEAQIASGKKPICRGFVLSATKSFKMFGQAPTFESKELARLQAATVITDEEAARVLSRQQFREYHTIKPRTKK